MRFTNDQIVDAYSEYLAAVEDDVWAAEVMAETDHESVEWYGPPVNDPD